MILGHFFYWIFVIFTEIFENGSLIYRNGRAANRLWKRYFLATGGRITCMEFFTRKGPKKQASDRFYKLLHYVKGEIVQTRCFFKNPRQPVKRGFGCKGLNFGIPSRVHCYRWILCVPRIKVTRNFPDLQVKFQHIIDDGKDRRGVIAVFPQ